jgi:hypothetical protein
MTEKEIKVARAGGRNKIIYRGSGYICKTVKDSV